MSWNYRVIKNRPDTFMTERCMYTINDVYYDDNQDIVNVGRESPVIGDDIEELKWVLQKMLQACDKPVIDYDTGEEV
jgi:hypothetical protein